VVCNDCCVSSVGLSFTRFVDCPLNDLEQLFVWTVLRHQTNMCRLQTYSAPVRHAPRALVSLQSAHVGLASQSSLYKKCQSFRCRGKIIKFMLMNVMN